MAFDFMSLDNYHLDIMRQNVTMIRQINATINDSYQAIEKNERFQYPPSNISTISDTGKQFSTYYQDINKSDNKGALSGLRKVALEMSKDSNDGNFLGLKDPLNDLKTYDYDQYINFFETANTVGDHYHSLGEWLSTYSEIQAPKQQSQFIDLSKEFMTKEGPKDERNISFSVFLKEIKEITQTKKTRESQVESLEDLYKKQWIKLTDAPDSLDQNTNLG
jgi:hypothetical protein